MRKFTKQTPTPSTRGTSSADIANVVYTYTDMRGNAWSVAWAGGSWRAYPAESAQQAYGGSPGIGNKRMFAAASDAGMLIDGIEERIEALRADGKLKPKPKPSGGGWGWLVIVGLVALAASDGGRR